MIYTFKSKAAANLIMLQAHGARMLQIIGKEPGPQGIVLPDQMPAALQALEEALAREDAELQEAARSAKAAGESVPELRDVSLRQRAKPFIDMLRRCHAADQSIVWGV
ncbi:MAG: DUF1840 domain-containing protein [Rhodoferax sp.]|jgi:hypothetical protein|nr:DUF1840 domain-containing protein [Rhodoferax sp.]